MSDAVLCLAHHDIMFINKNKRSRFDDLDRHEYSYSIFGLDSNISEYLSTRLSPRVHIDLLNRGSLRPDENYHHIVIVD